MNFWESFESQTERDKIEATAMIETWVECALAQPRPLTIEDLDDEILRHLATFDNVPAFWPDASSPNGLNGCFAKLNEGKDWLRGKSVLCADEATAKKLQELLAKYESHIAPMKQLAQKLRELLTPVSRESEKT